MKVTIMLLVALLLASLQFSSCQSNRIRSLTHEYAGFVAGVRCVSPGPADQAVEGNQYKEPKP